MATYKVTESLGSISHSMCIYKITNNIRGKSYIGQSRSLVRNRWHKHINGDTSCKNSAIHNAIAKYGVENFTFLVIDICETIEQLDYKEKMYILQLNTLAPDGYNITTGGGHGFTYSDEHRARLSIAAKNRTPEVRAKQSAMMKERMSIPEVKAFMADICRRTHTGRKQSVEQVEYRTKFRKGVKATHEQKVTLARAHMGGTVICCSNGKEYLSSYEASLDTDAIKDHIGSICNGKRKSSNGFKFWYKEVM